MDENKKDVVLVVLQKDGLNDALSKLNAENANLTAVIVDDGDDSTVKFNDAEVPTYSFLSIDEVIEMSKPVQPVIEEVEENLQDEESEDDEEEKISQPEENSEDDENSQSENESDSDDENSQSENESDSDDENSQTENESDNDDENSQSKNKVDEEVEEIPAVEYPVTWLIYGFENNVSDIGRMRNFLIENEVPKENIVNFNVFTQEDMTWIANLHFAEERTYNFFATGNSLVALDLDFDYPLVDKYKGVNLASEFQDLSQSYAIAQYVFKNAVSDSIKFVLIGVDINAFYYDSSANFSTAANAFKYSVILEDYKTASGQIKQLQYFVNENAKKKFSSGPMNKVDLNFTAWKESKSQALVVQETFEMDKYLSDTKEKFDGKMFNKNVKVLENYIKLCQKNNVVPVLVVLPWSPVVHKKYDKKSLFFFRNTLKQLQRLYGCKLIDLSVNKSAYVPLGFKWFRDMMHLTYDGSRILTGLLALRLYEEKLLPFSGFEKIKYDVLGELADKISHDRFSKMMKRILNLSVEKLRKKEKLKVGFVLDNAAMWCGDDLYNYFAESDRYEPTVFSFLHQQNKAVETVVEDWEHGIEQFKARGINVVGISGDETEPFPQQDLLIFLRPYMYMLPKFFQFSTISAETLIATIPYGFRTSAYDIYNLPVFHFAWKMFFDSEDHKEEHELNCQAGVSKNYYSGYPKLDLFFDDKAKHEYHWKTTTDKAIKIIYAPHWSIDEGVMYSTFQWNYQFMYEYAKNHPETSWVIKPHPSLLNSAVRRGLFPSVEAFEEYMQNWDNLPNAKVETGAYYQEIFATSDGMIQDCSSFIGEYQYTHKPMIFLTRETQEFNDLGNELMKVIYCVDGQDLEGIENLMQKIFIEGQDPMYEQRMEFFNKYLNYEKLNGVSASRYVFDTINNELS